MNGVPTSGSTVDSLTCSVDKLLLGPEVADDGDDPFQSKTADEEVVSEPDEADREVNILEKLARHEEFLTYRICDDLDDIDILHLCQANWTMHTVFSPVLRHRFAQLLKRFSAGREDGRCHTHFVSIRFDTTVTCGRRFPPESVYRETNLGYSRGNQSSWNELWNKELLRNVHAGDFIWVFCRSAPASSSDAGVLVETSEIDHREVGIYEARLDRGCRCIPNPVLYHIYTAISPGIMRLLQTHLYDMRLCEPEKTHVVWVSPTLKGSPYFSFLFTGEWQDSGNMVKFRKR